VALVLSPIGRRRAGPAPHRAREPLDRREADLERDARDRQRGGWRTTRALAPGVLGRRWPRTWCRFGGFAPAAAFVALATIGTVGIVSHLNADVRLWAFNHLLIGPETHRYHHSANHHGKYGTVTSVWDQLFHTFVFEPVPPTDLGLADPTTYPNPERFVTVVTWPLRRTEPPAPAPSRSSSDPAGLAAR
jgi:hypothetical protein